MDEIHWMYYKMYYTLNMVLKILWNLHIKTLNFFKLYYKIMMILLRQMLKCRLAEDLKVVGSANVFLSEIMIVMFSPVLRCMKWMHVLVSFIY
jgi:hypothetical protein